MSVTGVNLSKEIDNWIEKKSSKNWQSVLSSCTQTYTIKSTKQ